MSKLSVGSSLGQPVGTQPSGSLSRVNRGAPLNRAGSNLTSSTSSRKDSRPINDRNWQYEQLLKVRQFATEQFPDLNCSNIKSGITLDCFIELIHNLFQLIDRRINITKENYIIEVPVNLNRYRYPVSVKPSLMKTVNTPHCWPSVLGIFTWLVDFIKEINEEEEWTDSLHDLVDKAACKSFALWNSGCSEDEFKDQVLKKLDHDLARIFEVEQEDMVKVDQELIKLEEISNDLDKKKKILWKK